jgi:iduronate 2-sulfatase
MDRPGRRTGEIVEFLDLYPTLCALAGLPLPQHVEGVSFAGLLKTAASSHKGFAVSEKTRRSFMGKSLRTPDFRYTEWRNPTGKVVARELYDHREDPWNETLETENLAEHQDYAAVIKSLEDQLRGILGNPISKLP